jgi:hypothetical protein
MAFYVGVYPRGKSVYARAQAGIEAVDTGTQSINPCIQAGLEPVDLRAKVEQAADQRRRQEPDRRPRHRDHLEVTVTPGADSPRSCLNDPVPLRLHAPK